MIKAKAKFDPFNKMLRSFEVILLVILAGIVVHAPLTVLFGGVVWPDYDVLIKSWKEILLLFASGLAIILISQRAMWRELFSDWLIKIIAAYCLLHVLLLFVFDNDALASAAGLMIDLRYILYFVLVYAAVRLDRAFRRPFIIVAAAGAALVVGFAILQVAVLPDDILRHIGYGANTIQPYMTIDQNPNFVRINSTLRGPNPLGAYALIVLSIVAAAIARRAILNPSAWRFVAIFLIIGSLVAVWFSYSRSALVGATAALLFILITTISAKISWKKMLIAVAAIGVLTGGILFTARDNHFVANVILHENPDSSSQSKSNDEHFASLIDGTERMVSQPFGAGVGSTGSASLYGDKPLIIENQYLFTAHESGWLGLVLYMAIFGIIMGRLWVNRRDYLSFGLVASGIGLSLIGLLLPVWADDTVAIVWWGLAGLAVGYVLKRKDEKSERTIE